MWQVERLPLILLRVLLKCIICDLWQGHVPGPHKRRWLGSQADIKGHHTALRPDLHSSINTSAIGTLSWRNFSPVTPWCHRVLVRMNLDPCSTVSDKSYALFMGLWPTAQQMLRWPVLFWIQRDLCVIYCSLFLFVLEKKAEKAAANPGEFLSNSFRSKRSSQVID